MGHDIYNNSAIGSWSGYIYQGLCAIYVSLKMILEDEDAVKDYLLFLDSYEDFSINKQDLKVLSLHQCKVKKSGGNYHDALTQMKEQKNQLVNAGLCDSNVNLFFHCNTEPKNLGEIKMYEYERADGSKLKKCDPYEIIEYVQTLVKKYHIKHKSHINSQYTLGLLFRIVNETVLKIHNISLIGKKKLHELAREKSCAIEFSHILEVLDKSEEEDFSKECLWFKVRFHLYQSFMEIKDELYEIGFYGLNQDNVEDMESKLANMEIDELSEFMLRALPTDVPSSDFRYVINTTNKNVSNNLINVVGKCNYILSPNLDWLRESQRFTPASFNSKIREQICVGIVKNSANSDAIREYDWFVTDCIDNTVPEILQVLGKIKNFDLRTLEKERENIFKMKAKGILTLNDFNNGKY